MFLAVPETSPFGSVAAILPQTKRMAAPGQERTLEASTSTQAGRVGL